MLIPVILSGGSGSRLWPVSRTMYPKQLHELTSEQSLLQNTVSRLNGLTDCAAPLVICNSEHRFMVAEQLRASGITPGRLVLENVGRNTAPALAIAALEALQTHPDAVLLVLAADHSIHDTAAFQEAVKQAYQLALREHLVTFGVVPRSAHTGYGYIERKSTPLDDAAEGVAYGVAKFEEKPDAQTAQSYVESGDYYWNSGMFVFSAAAFIRELAQHRPDILDACKTAFEQAERDADFLRLGAAFDSCPSESIDYAVMEKTNRAAVVPLDVGWSDVGSWQGLWEVINKDASGNATQGDVVLVDAKDTLVRAQERLVAVVGLDNVAVVETADAVLVANKDHAEGVKKVVNLLNDAKRSEAEVHKKVHRPWGSFEGLAIDDYYQVKRLTLIPGAKISLQLHHKRSEHWIVVRGRGKVTNGDDISVLGVNDRVFIPVKNRHQLENIGDENLEVVEVQTGTYFGEDDIERFEDQYGRI